MSLTPIGPVFVTVTGPNGEPIGAELTTARPERGGKPASRQGMVQLAGFIPAAAKHELDVFAVMNKRTIQSVVEEMYNRFASDYGLHPLDHFAAATEDRTA
jgi:hypothetical protein